MAPKSQAASAAKRQRLQAQDAERTAQGIVESMASISEIAVERELEALTTQLRADHALLYALSSWMRDGTLKNLMNGSVQPAAPAAAKPKPGKEALKPRQTKWKNISESQFKRICLHLRPDWEGESLGPQQTFTEIGQVMLGVKSTDALPAAAFPWCTTWPELLKASSMRWQGLGRRFENTTLSEMFGLWKIQDDKKIRCALGNHQTEVPLGDQATSIDIGDCWDRDASVNVTTPMGKIQCAISELFENAGIDVFAGEGDGGAWTLPGYEQPEAPGSDEEDDAVSVASGASSTASPARTRAPSHMLSSALRARMQGSGRASSAPPPS